jgi:nucleoside-diphosphate-sugar epimerase
MTITAWRAQHEQAILASRADIDVAIVRPALVYGRGEGIRDPWWSPILAAKGKPDTKIEIPARKDTRPSLVHVDDVVSGLHAAIDQIEGRLGSWPVFDLASEHVGIEAIIDAIKEAVDVKKEVEYVGPKGNLLHEALAVRANVGSGRAMTVLGWQPKIREFLLRLPVYIKASAAAEEAK